jgi:hypothetical protein
MTQRGPVVMTQLQKVAVHYTIRLAMCVAAWGLKAAAQRMSGTLGYMFAACAGEPAAACACEPAAAWQI